MTNETTQGTTVGEMRKQEGDVLYGLVLLFTYGQLALILWDLFMLIPGFSLLTGVPDNGKIHSIGEITSMYLALLGIYIGRNAVRRYRGGADTDTVPHYLFLRIKRGYFYVAMWGTLCFVAYMLKAVSLISRMPYELTITTFGVITALFGDKTLKGFFGKRTTGDLEAAAAESSNHDIIMNYVEQNNRITNKLCRDLTGLKDAQASHLLSQLAKEGKLLRKGNGPETWYEKPGA